MFDWRSHLAPSSQPQPLNPSPFNSCSLPGYGVDVHVNLRHLEESAWAEAHDTVSVPRIRVALP